MPALIDRSERHWFVTGASGGLGRHIADYALRQGDRVTATGRRRESLDDLREATRNAL